MPIDFIQPLPVGNALRLIFSPPAGAEFWRVLRRVDDAFVGEDDPGAVVVLEDSRDSTTLDRLGLVNGTPYFYCLFAWDGATWSASDVVSATPAATYEGGGPDPQSIVRERIELGLAIEIARGTLKPASGKIKVVTGPFAHQDGITFPVVSVHHDSSAPAERGIGERLADDQLSLLDAATSYSAEGWLERVSLNIVAVSHNGDERIELRKALKRIIMANLPVFDAEGMIQIQFSQTDQEEFGEKNLVLYESAGSFDCMAPAWVGSDVDVIEAVSLSAEAM